jgi:hypothetical protein
VERQRPGRPGSPRGRIGRALASLDRDPVGPRSPRLHQRQGHAESPAARAVRARVQRRRRAPTSATRDPRCNLRCARSHRALVGISGDLPAALAHRAGTAQMTGTRMGAKKLVCTREPSGSRASTQGDVSSTRRPSAATMRSITWRTASSPSNSRSATLSIRTQPAKRRTAVWKRTWAPFPNRRNREGGQRPGRLILARSWVTYASRDHNSVVQTGSASHPTPARVLCRQLGGIRCRLSCVPCS